MISAKNLLIYIIVPFCFALSVCAQSTVHAQTRHPQPVPNFEVRGLCINDSTYFINKTLMGYDYQWFIFNDKGDTIYNSVEKDIAFYFRKRGLYTIFLQADNGHLARITRTVRVDTLPHANFSFWTCYNEFTNYSTCADEYIWTLPDGSTSTEASPKYKFSKPGPYTATLTAKKGTKTDVLTKTGTIYLDSMHVPSAEFNYFPALNDSKSLLYIANDSSGDTYHWVFLQEGVFDDTGFKITHPITADTINVYLAVTNGCGFNTSVAQVITHQAVIHENEFTSSNAFIYPNPVTDQLNLTITHLSERSKGLIITIINADGIVVNQQKLAISTTTYSYKLDTHTFPKGIYLVQILCNDGMITRKIVIQ